ncbi:MAG: DUF1850 domain-containing protein [Deltaproteobacteria bacterium]|nr:DUF1850 domain-containing protein [Deltaproteobacteria bacterium]
MKAWVRRLFPFLLFLLVPGLLLQVTRSGYTRVELREAGTGRKILSTVLRDGREVVLTWKNSLFRLHVTEIFHARGGTLVLREVTFADPHGPPPPPVDPEDVDDLYHTGGPFSAQGLNRTFTRVTYRVSEIGNPRMKMGDREVAFKEEVGFGGGVVLTTAIPKWWETLL